LVWRISVRTGECLSGSDVTGRAEHFGGSFETQKLYFVNKLQTGSTGKSNVNRMFRCNRNLVPYVATITSAVHKELNQNMPSLSSLAKYRLSTIRSPDCIIQSVYNEILSSRKFFKIYKCDFSDVKVFLFIIGVQICAYMFRLSRGTSLGFTETVYLEVYRFLNFDLSCCGTDICK
jgi:hypothetical protein